jgi:hypothetical protein
VEHIRTVLERKKSKKSIFGPFFANFSNIYEVKITFFKSW